MGEIKIRSIMEEKNPSLARRIPAIGYMLLDRIVHMSSFFVPVNKHGSNLESFRIFEALFKTDTPLIFFPAGRTGRPEGGGITDEKIIDAPWSKTFFKKSRIHGRLIIPVFVQGRNSNFFYSAAWLRKKSGIKMILEMLLLADELFKKRDSVIEVTAGQPVDPADLDFSVSDAEWSDALRSYVHALGEGEKADFISWIKNKEEGAGHGMG